MKFKLEVNVQELIEGLFEDAADSYDPDYGIDFDFDFKEDIKSDIINQTKNKVLKLVSEPIKLQIQDQVKGLVSSEYSKVVSNKVAEFIKEGRVKEYSSSGNEITVEEWIDKKFKDSFDPSSKLKNIVKNQCEELSKEIKDRYDLLFASTLVSKLNDQGLLKDGVFKALMAENKN